MARKGESALFRGQERCVNGLFWNRNECEFRSREPGRVMNPFSASVEKVRATPHSGRWLLVIQPDPGGGVRPVLDQGVLGGRWSPPRSFPVMYTTEDDPATREQLVQWLQDEDSSDLIVVCMRVHLGRVLDLCSPLNRVVLGATSQELIESTDMGVSQAIGLAAYRAGFQGILYPRPPYGKFRNLAIFPERVSETGPGPL